MEVGDLCIEMAFATVLLDTEADVFHHPGKHVAADMGMCIDQNVWVGAEAHELIQHLADVASLGGTGEKLSVRKSPGSSFPEAIV